MRLLYDLDGTIVHFDRGYDLIMNTDYIHLTDIPRSHQQTSFNLWEGRTPEEQDAIREVMNRPGFYRDLEPIDGAVDAVREADALGYEVFFLSAPWTSNPTCAQDKYDWVGQHFGDDWRDKLILAKDKTIVSGDILWDDKHPIEKKARADWTQVYFDQPYNRSAPGLRIQSWLTDEWKLTLHAVSEQKRAKESRWKQQAFELYNDLQETT